MADTSERGLTDPRRRSLGLTVPVVLVGSLAIASMNLTGNLDLVGHKRPHRTGAVGADAARVTIKSATTAETETPAGVLAVESVPVTYVVQSGDSVSAIARRFGVSTAAVLALNGLSARSLIFPRQVLRLSAAVVSAAPAISAVRTAPAPAPAPASTSTSTSTGTGYRIVPGDTIGRIASRFGVSVQALLRVNGLTASSIIYSGKTLIIPGGASVSTASVSPPVAAAAAPSTATGSSATRSYTIASGDTISAIAKRFGVAVQSVLGANGLTGSSIIYAGRTIIIPGASGLAPAAVAPAGIQVAHFGPSIAPLTADTQANAGAIISTGKKLGVPAYGIIIALAAAAQESGLHNLTSGDRDSVGLFQQRPGTGWGTPAQLIDPTYASRLFFGGPSNPNKGRTRGLLDIPAWQSLSISQAAQAVQISAYPTAYAKWELSARAWYAALG